MLTGGPVTVVVVLVVTVCVWGVAHQATTKGSRGYGRPMA